MMSSKNNGFTAGDIERYHSGKMSPPERHALEKAALDDPFLADALEGYAFTSTATEDLAKIQSRLQEQFEQKKVIPFFQKYRWLSVAALFIIIAGTAWLVYDLSGKGAQQSVAVQTETGSGENTSVVTTQQSAADSNIQPTIPVEKTSASKNENAGSGKKSKELTRNLSNEQRQNDIVISNSRNNQSNAYYNKEANSNSDRRFLAPGNQKEGNKGNIESVEISRNNPVSITAKAKDATNDNRSNSNVVDKVVIGNSPAARVRSLEEQNDSVRHFDIVLKPLPKDSQPPMQEVVVGYGAQKKMDKYPKVTIDTLEPAEGYVVFDDYVANNLNMPEELKTKIPAGEIQLSFDVDQNGKPVNITVVKSLCEKCDEEAIRLLKEGPKWKGKKNKKGKITIKF